jgi:hypothetical protein
MVPALQLAGLLVAISPLPMKEQGDSTAYSGRGMGTGNELVVYIKNTVSVLQINLQATSKTIM